MKEDYIEYQVCYKSYYRVSGQVVKYHKSKVEFSKDINKAVKREISDILQKAPTNGICTYLAARLLIT